MSSSFYNNYTVLLLYIKYPHGFTEVCGGWWGGRAGSAQEIFGLLKFIKELKELMFTYLLILIKKHGKLVLFSKL